MSDTLAKHVIETKRKPNTLRFIVVRISLRRWQIMERFSVNETAEGDMPVYVALPKKYRNGTDARKDWEWYQRTHGDSHA